MIKIEVENLCNQCRGLDFSAPGCKKAIKTPNGAPQVKIIPTAFTNIDGFTHIFKPSWCPGKESFKPKPKIKE